MNTLVSYLILLDMAWHKPGRFAIKYHSQIGSTNCSGTQQPGCYIATVTKRWHCIVVTGRHITVSLEQLLTVPSKFHSANLFTKSFFASAAAILWCQASRCLDLCWTFKRMTLTDRYRVLFKIVFKEIYIGSDATARKCYKASGW